MLRKISKIKHFGVFGDYTWDSALPPFERYNVIYGDNGSGKTTLSRLLDCLKDGEHSEFPELEFKIETQSGDLANGTKATRKIRVFNADFVQANIEQLDGKLKHILIIGEENKAAAETLAVEQGQLAKRKEAVTAAEGRIAEHQTGRGKVFTAIAKTISEATSGGTAVRNYRKNNAEAAFGNLSKATTLSASELQARRNTIHQEVMEKIVVPAFPGSSGDSTETTIAQRIQALTKAAGLLCAKSAISNAIARLRDNPAIGKWVEDGHILHKQLTTTDCEFCGQPMPADRWERLDAHFSTADQALKCEIETAINDWDQLRLVLTTVPLPDRMAFYSDLRERFEVASSKWHADLKGVLGGIDDARQTLSTKLLSRGTTLPFSSSIDFHDLEAAFNSICDVVSEHNAKTAGFDTAKANAVADIEAHYLTSIKSEVAAFDDKIAGEQKLIKSAVEAADDGSAPSMAELEVAIAEKRAQISSAHKAGDLLTERLQAFLGRNELVFHSGDDGYHVLRNGKPARKLSEGERTAIAFIYFTVQLTDRDFTLADGIVVIDDPVSSLDASSVYQAFAFLKNAVKDAKQVILMTHNFGFLRLLLNWLEHLKGAKYYMLVCKSDAAGRSAKITALDKALIDHPTEYHFLFKLLATFQTDGTIASCYHIPNVTRKVLETFLDFHIPEKKSLHVKLSEIPYDENKKTAIYKFSNDLSHFTGQGFEPGLVEESRKNVVYLLDLIKDQSPRHFQGMMASAGKA
jgi:wobble nucleotide-excising tRNase